MVIMPNHFHCIIENTITETPVGTDLHVCPAILPGNRQLSGKYKISGTHILLGEHAGSPLHRAVQWFKTMTANAYIHGVRTKYWPPFDGKLWQRNYYEHIIRDEQSYITIAEYIANNPVYWVKDELYDGEKE
jgi:putative transposase